MHELSLLASVVDVVEQAAREAGAHAIRVVALKVGAQSGAVPEALYGAWPIAIDGHRLFCDAESRQTCELQLEEVPATVGCPNCKRDVEIDEFFALRCPECAAPTGNITHGREFNVAWVEWDT